MQSETTHRANVKCHDVRQGLGDFLRARAKLPFGVILLRSGSAWRIWLICALLVGIVGSQICYTVWRERNIALVQQGQSAKSLSLVLAEQTSRYIAIVDLVLQTVQARLHDLDMTSAEAFSAGLARPDTGAELPMRLQRIPGNNALLLIDTNGRLVGQFPAGSAPLINAMASDFFQHFQVNADGGLFISRPVRVASTGAWKIILARRMSAPNGRFVGVIAIAIDAGYLQAFYKVPASRQ